jgi:predicted metalloprotease with PDZ domain
MRLVVSATSLPFVTVSLVIAQLIAPAAAARQAAPATARARYSIRVTAEHPRLADVSVDLGNVADVLEMDPEYAEALPDRWAQFVSHLTAVDPSGREVKVSYQGAARWRLGAGHPSSIHLHYQVSLEHDKTHWEFGAKEAAYAKPNWVFYTGRALFIAPPNLGASVVDFVLPPDWTVTTPWQAAPGPRAFAVPGFRELTHVGLVMGKYAEQTLRAGGTNVAVALGQDLAGSMPLFIRALKPLLRAAADLFGGSPPGRFVVLANRDTYTSGGAFLRSISMVFQEAPTAETKTFLAHFLGHEMLHLWIGGAIRAADEDHQNWLSEGFTDYLSYQLMLQEGLLTPRQLSEQASIEYGKYRAQAGRISLFRAGEHKDKNYDLVYSGGYVAALSLDTEIRRRSSGHRDLKALMQRMYRQFGSTGSRYTYDDVVRLASGCASADLSEWFRNYVQGIQVLAAPPKT